MTDRLDAVISLLRRRWFAIAVGVAVVAAVGVGYLVGERRFSESRTTVLKEIDTYVGVLTRARSNREERPKLDSRLQSLADRTLGPSLETVDSEVRRRLNRVCEELGLVEFSVTTGTSTAKPTPAKREFRRTEERKLRDEPDFVEVQATVTASGSALQVFQLLFRVDAEPWLKRIELLRLNPDASGEKVRVTLRANTIFFPGTTAKAPLVVDQQALASASRFAALFGSNPFKLPPPPPPVVVATSQPSGAPASQPTPAGAAATPPATAPVEPSGFPYGEWQITGVVEGPGGSEVWLRHLPSGTPLTLAPGGAVGELTLRSVRYDFAVFEGPGGAFRIQVGNNLTQRLDAGG